MTGRRKFWGWGYEGAGPKAARIEQTRALVRTFFAGNELLEVVPPRIEEISLRPARYGMPSALAPLCTTEPYERAARTS